MLMGWTLERPQLVPDVAANSGAYLAPLLLFPVSVVAPVLNRLSGVGNATGPRVLVGGLKLAINCCDFKQVEKVERPFWRFMRAS